MQRPCSCQHVDKVRPNEGQDLPLAFVSLHKSRNLALRGKRKAFVTHSPVIGEAKGSDGVQVERENSTNQAKDCCGLVDPICGGIIFNHSLT